MRIDIKDLKKAVTWLETYTKEDIVTLVVTTSSSGGTVLYIDATDKYSTMVEICIYEAGTLLPKIKKTDNL